MAAVRACKCGCFCYIRPATIRYSLLTRFLSTKSEGLAEKGSSYSDHSKRKKRDAFTVLKALSSTVQKVPGASNIGFLEDAYLTPRSDFTKREYMAALESGRNAAEFVIKKYPDLCSLRQAVPAWPDEFAIFEEKENEKTLQHFIESEKVDEAIKLYELLEKKGEVLNIGILNQLLDLVGYYGVGIDATLTKTSEIVDATSSSSSDSDGSSSDEEGQPANKSGADKTDSAYGFKVKDLLLSKDSYASELFSKIENKTAETYEAYIFALLKYDEFKTAQRFYEEMREKGLRGSTYLYKAFIDSINKQTDVATAKDKWNLAEDFLKKMTEDKSAIPDVGIYNSLLSLASQLNEEAPSKTSMLLREMIANGLEPSLGSYLYILEAFDTRKSEKFAMLREIVHRVHSQEGRFEVADVRDASFFSIAMTLAKIYGSAELAKLLMKAAYRDGNWTLLGRSSSAFLGNYIATLCRSESDVDVVFEEYDRLVPNELVPRDWVYAELFRRLERGERPERIFKLCSDMKVNRVRLTYPICERIFLALSSPLPNELLKDGLDAALETMKWMSMFDIPVTGMVLNQVVKLYALNGMLNEAIDTIKLLEEKDDKPMFTVLKTILDGAAELKDQKIASKVANKMVEHEYHLSNAEIESLTTKLELAEHERSIFRGLSRTN